jgi:cobalt-zinc-cadmium efflux system protein
VMFYTKWYWLDPVVSLVIVLVIIVGTWGLLRESTQLALNAVPEQIDLPAVEDYLRGLAGVSDVHDLHIWGLSTTECALTVHLVMPAGPPGDEFVERVRHTLQDKYEVHHSTLQIERGTLDHACALAIPVPKDHGHDHGQDNGYA